MVTLRCVVFLSTDVANREFGDFLRVQEQPPKKMTISFISSRGIIPISLDVEITAPVEHLTAVSIHSTMLSAKYIAAGFAGFSMYPFVVRVDAFDQQHVNHTEAR